MLRCRRRRSALCSPLRGRHARHGVTGWVPAGSVQGFMVCIYPTPLAGGYMSKWDTMRCCPANVRKPPDTRVFGHLRRMSVTGVTCL